MEANIKALKLLADLDERGAQASPDEQEVLARYVGWGGLADALDEARADKADPDHWSYAWRNDQQKDWEKKWLSSYKEISGLLSSEDLRKARESILNAHFTSREVVHGVWDIVQHLGVKGGTFLEPAAGVGNFFAGMPPALIPKCNLIGVELDSVTGRILKQLYPDGQMLNVGFEAAGVKKHSVDLVIGNFPFGDYKVLDKESPQLSKHSIHNYFFLKSLEKLKPGGLIVAVTSAFSMDAQRPAFRKAMAEQADLVGAIRLPNTAFKANAGTEVVTDILVFRKKDESHFQGQPFLATESVEVPGGGYGEVAAAHVNQYFVDHPHMVLGEFAAGGLYGKGGLTVNPKSGATLKEQLAAAIEHLPGAIARGVTERERWSARPTIVTSEKEGLLVLHDGEPCLVTRGPEGNRILAYPYFLNETKPGRKAALAERLETYVPLREAAKELIAAQLREGVSEEELEALRAELNRAYDVFTKDGTMPLSGKGAAGDLAYDVEWPLVQALEIAKAVSVDGIPTKVFEKAEIFRKRTIFPRTEPQEAQSLEDAISISMAFRGKVDAAYLAKLVNGDPDLVVKEAIRQHLAFVNPDTGILEPADEYLSGMVREKLEKAELAAESDPDYTVNVEALRAVQPLPIPIQSISVRLGAGGWLPPEVYASFAEEVLGLHVDFAYSNAAKAWSINDRGWSANIAKATTYSTTRVKAIQLLEDCINMRQTTVKDPVPGERGKYVVNQGDTLQAQVMQEKIDHAFRRFVREHETLSHLVEEAYNRTFNGAVKRSFKVPDIKFLPGANQAIVLEAYQKRAAFRGVRESTILSHVVGAGKTFTLASIAMEMRRLGTAKKPMIVVQGSTLGQFASAFRTLYPDANILVPNEHQRDAANRQRLMSQIATGDYDAVIVPHSFFDMIEDDPELVARFVAAQVAELEAEIRNLGRGADRHIVRAIESRIKFYKDMEAAGVDVDELLDGEERSQKKAVKAGRKRQVRLEAKLDRRVDHVLTFQELGIDALLVDEAHRYKRRDFTTHIDKTVKGIDKGSSKRSMGLLLKADYIRDRNNGKNVILATGTPISNTIAELWTMMGYVRPDLLEAYQVDGFDEFVGSFAEISAELEMTYSGAFKAVSRLRRFVNGPELLTLWSMCADSVRSEDITRQALPRMVGGKVQIVDIEPTETVEASIKEWRDYLLAWQKMSGADKRANSHVPILVMGRSRQISVDPRLVDPSLPDVPGSKLHVAADKVAQIWEAGRDQRLTQLVFADLFQSPDTKVKGRKRFNVYDDFKKKLVERGIPADEIVIVTAAVKKNSEAMAALLAKLQSGEASVGIGASEHLGVGVNVQDRLKAEHHLDLPMLPKDLEQRHGRIIRAGNMNDEVEIFSYGVRRTLDASLAQIVMNKAKFIQQIMEGSFEEREFEDPSGAVTLSAAEMLASYADDPMVFEKMRVEMEVQRIRQERASWEQEKRNLAQSIRRQEGTIQWIEDDLANINAMIRQTMPLFGNLANYEKEFQAYSLVERLDDLRSRIGKLSPAKVDTTEAIRNHGPALEIEGLKIQPSIVAHLRIEKGEGGRMVVAPHSIEVSWHIVGIDPDRLSGRFNSGQGAMLLKSLESALRKLNDQPAVREVELDRAQKKLATLKEVLEAPFEREAELEEKSAELERLNAELERRGTEEATAAKSAVSMTDIETLEAETADKEA